jgi:hypothetical protein
LVGRRDRLNAGWIIHPAMDQTARLAAVAAFSAVIIGSDFVLSGPEFSNVKLLDTLVFVSAYLFGFRVGASVGLLSETVWSFASPLGMAGAITPFLVLGELLFAGAGWGAARVWGRGSVAPRENSLYLGALLAICAFAWDFETNAATAILSLWPNVQLSEFLAIVFGPLTLPFDLAHELSDFAFGLVLAPSMIFLIPRVARRRP